MDGFFRILEKTSSELICTRPYNLRYFSISHQSSKFSRWKVPIFDFQSQFSTNVKQYSIFSKFSLHWRISFKKLLSKALYSLKLCPVFISWIQMWILKFESIKLCNLHALIKTVHKIFQTVKFIHDKYIDNNIVC